MSDFLRRRRADRLLEDGVKQMQRTVCRVVQGKLRPKVHLDISDIEGVYNERLHVLHQKLLDGEEIPNPVGWLVHATHLRSLSLFRALHPERFADDAEIAEQPAVTPDLADQAETALRLRFVREGMAERLTDEERKLYWLCAVEGVERKDAAKALGISAKRADTVLDGKWEGGVKKRGGAGEKVGKMLAAIEQGRWCDERRSLMRAYAVGLLADGGERQAVAREHLSSCSGCRAFVRTVQGLGALFPPFMLPGLGGGDAARQGLDTFYEVLRSGRGAIEALAQHGPEVAVGAVTAGGAAGAAVAGSGAAAAGGSGGAVAGGSGLLGGGLAAKLAVACTTVAVGAVGGGVALSTADGEMRTRPAASDTEPASAGAPPARAVPPHDAVAAPATRRLTRRKRRPRRERQAPPASRGGETFTFEQTQPERPPTSPRRPASPTPAPAPAPPADGETFTFER